MGAIALSVWGGFHRRVFGVMFGMVGIGLSSLLFGFGQKPGVWAISRFGASLHSPLIFSSYMAVWYAKVAPDPQGRVFAADYLIGIVIESSAGLSAGLLSDRVFEPALRSNSWFASAVGAIVGTEAGSGMAFLHLVNAIGLVLIGLGSLKVKQFRSAESMMPDHEVS